MASHSLRTGAFLRRSLCSWSGEFSQHKRLVSTATLQKESDLVDTQVYHPKQSRPIRMAVKNAKPFSEFLTDTFNRQHDYLRISVTERCNLRCLYCMPEEINHPEINALVDGIQLSPQSHILTSSEIFYLSALFVSQGVTKIRLTGGEPTVRKDILSLMKSIGSLKSKGLNEIAITTNGISLHRKLDTMVESGLTGINLSLDTLDPFQFQIMTRRNGFDTVMKSINRILEMKKAGTQLKLKINCVVMRGLNDKEIIPFVELGREQDIEIRFIEYMPFGGNKWSQKKMVSFQEMLDNIKIKYPNIHRVQGHKNDTSKTYQIPGFVGQVGFITSMTNDFCGTCNRLRITSDGNLKVCLHGNTEVSLRDIIREGNDGKAIDEEAFELIKEQEMQSSTNTPSKWLDREQRLLEVIGAAVKRKKEKHAGMGTLENMENRPMILIDPPVRMQSFKKLQKIPVPTTIPIPNYILPQFNINSQVRMYSSSATRLSPKTLPHLTPQGSAHMVNISSKQSTLRRAVAIGHTTFSLPDTLATVTAGNLKKGDVLSVSRIAAIMAAKKCPDIIPLCHPITLSGIEVTVDMDADLGIHGGIKIKCQVSTIGGTGVEMEALTGVMGGLLSAIDMVKGVDKGCIIEQVKVVLKEGGRSGTWRDPAWVE